MPSHVPPRAAYPLRAWALPFAGLAVGAAFGVWSIASSYAAEPIDASGLATYGALFGAGFGLLVGAIGSLGAYLARRFRRVRARNSALRTASGAGCGVAFGWLLLLIQSAVTSGAALDAGILALGFLSTAGAFVGVWLTENRAKITR